MIQGCTYLQMRSLLVLLLLPDLNAMFVVVLWRIIFSLQDFSLGALLAALNREEWRSKRREKRERKRDEGREG